MNESYREIFYAAIVFIIIFVNVRALYFNISMFFTRISLTKKPTEEKAMKAYRLLKAPLGVKIQNHPKNWSEYKTMFLAINKCPEIPSELKEKLKKVLGKKGLFIENIRIIDNYTKNNI